MLLATNFDIKFFRSVNMSKIKIFESRSRTHRFEKLMKAEQLPWTQAIRGIPLKFCTVKKMTFYTILFFN